MNKLEHLTPHELLARVEDRNRRFKVASVVFGAILIIGLTVLVVIGLVTLQGVNNQLKQQKRLLDSQQQILSQIKASSDQRTQQLQELNDHIDCIASFFDGRTRTGAAITNLDECVITSDSGVTSNPKAPGSSDTAAEQPKTSNNSPSSNNTPPGKPSKPETPAPTGIRRVPLVNGLLNFLGIK